MRYECGTCRKQFPAGIREEHFELTGHSKPLWECYRCPRWFTSEKGRFAHMTAKNHFMEEGMVQCDFCEEWFENQKVLDRHEVVDHDLVTCALCDWEFGDLERLEEHFEEEHPGARLMVRCTWEGCEESFDDNEARVKHGADAHGSVICGLCKWKFNDEGDLNRHRALKHPEARLPFMCTWEGCKERFENEEAPERHEKDDHDVVYCGLCNCEFQEEGDLKEHITEEHPGAPLTFGCTYKGCGETFLAREEMNAHVEEEHVSKDTEEHAGAPLALSQDNSQEHAGVHSTFMCTHEGCGETFPTQGELNFHMEGEHIFKDYEYECQLCHGWLEDKQALKEHEVNSHHYCNDCDRTFDTLTLAKQHLTTKIHRGQSTACPYCSRRFTAAAVVAHHLERGACPSAKQLNRDSLYEIIRAKDPHGLISKHIPGWTPGPSKTVDPSPDAFNGRRFECTLCNREFRTLETLKDHLNSPIHQQKLYHCPKPKCGQGSATLAGIISHLESESCGYTKFERVQLHFGSLIDPRRRLTAF